jgi:hypothetical protein
LDIKNEKRRKELEAEAQAAIQKGDDNAALDALVEAERLPAEIKVPDAPKPQGVSFRTVWKWKIVDFSKVRDDLKLPNEKVINALVTSSKGETQLAGIEVWSEKVVASR